MAKRIGDLIVQGLEQAVASLKARGLADLKMTTLRRDDPRVQAFELWRDHAHGCEQCGKAARGRILSIGIDEIRKKCCQDGVMAYEHFYSQLSERHATQQQQSQPQLQPEQQSAAAVAAVVGTAGETGSLRERMPAEQDLPVQAGFRPS